MSYLSLKFALFVLLFVILFYVVPKKFRGPVLLCASLIFYGLFDLRYFLFLGFTALTTFFAAKVLEKTTKKKSARQTKAANGARQQINAIILLAVAVLVFCFSVIEGENVWTWIHQLLLGLFSFSALF